METCQKIPYGIASYKTIRQENSYYIDKTRFLPLLEDTGKFLFLIRPRRFGKSSWLTVLESYYDIARQEEWDLLFKGNFIYEHPTPEKHAYLILKFNFSQVDPNPEHVHASFLEHTHTCFFRFGERYRAFLGDEYFNHIAQKTSAHGKLEFLLQYAGLQGHKVYDLLHFANLMRQMAYQGDWEPVFRFLAAEVDRQTSIRDYLSGEKVIQTFLLAYLNVTDYYLTRTEDEMGKGFADLYLEPFWQKYPEVRRGYLIELKYAPRSEWSEARGQQELAAARSQLQQYRSDPRTTHSQSVTCVALVFCGWELKIAQAV